MAWVAAGVVQRGRRSPRERIKSTWGRNKVGGGEGSGWAFWMCGSVGVRRNGGPYTRKPPLHLIPVCGILDIRTGLDIFGARRWMAKIIQSRHFRTFAAVW